jgi:RNA polymerase sigma-70 factor (ECF subfamily)
VLHPDVVLRADTGQGAIQKRAGAEAIASQAILFRSSSPETVVTETVLVNGAPGLLSVRGGRPFSVVGFTLTDGLIARIDIIADPERLARLGIAAPAVP